MKPIKVAKLIIADKANNYLIMWRDNHPEFGHDPDLPGGTVEDGESLAVGMVREVKEEINIDIDINATRLVYEGDEYSNYKTIYALYIHEPMDRPEITMSWEHNKYEWMSRQEFITIAESANDTYMHMVADTLQNI